MTRKTSNKKGIVKPKKQPKKAIKKPVKKTPAKKSNLNAPTQNSKKYTTVTSKGLVPIGRTLKTKDEYLPKKKGMVKQLKEERWVAVIDKNTKEELAVVKLTTKNQSNTTELAGYKAGNKRRTFFGHFVEINDNEGKPIKVSEKFAQNHPKNDLTTEQVKTIQNKVLHKVKQSQTNLNKIKKLKK